MAFANLENDPKVQAERDNFWLEKCIELASSSANTKDVPIAAIVVQDNRIVGQAFNRKEIDQNPIAHAEVLALQEASRNLNRWRLIDCTLYVSLEPCIMCTGAIVSSRVKRVVYATADSKAGAIESVYKVFEDNKLNHQPEITSGIKQEKASHLLKNFFSKLRDSKKESNVTEVNI